MRFKKRLSGFWPRAIAYSLALHWLLLLILGGGMASHPAPGPKALIAATLHPDLSAATDAQPHLKIAREITPGKSRVAGKSPSKLAARTPEPILPATLRRHPQSPEEHPREMAESLPSIQGIEDNALLSRDDELTYRIKVARAASRLKNNPSIARQRGLEGAVILTLEVSGAGNRPIVSMSQSSGYDVIDSEAVALLSMAASQVSPPEKLSGQRLKLQVPISYSDDTGAN